MKILNEKDGEICKVKIEDWLTEEELEQLKKLKGIEITE